MSPTIPSLLACALVFGSAALNATTCVAAAEEPGGTPASAAPSAAEGPSVLLLSNGQVLSGRLAEDGDGYVLTTKHGQIRYRRRQVEGIFRTIDEAYEHRLRLTPRNDPDDLMKLAQWCVSNGLPGKAIEHLRAVLEMDPDHHRAKGMVFQIEAASARTRKDDSVLRTSAEEPATAAPASADAEAPGRLNLNDLRTAYRSDPKSAGVPVIFDLPQPQAVRKYREFAATVHPILQKQCASCHNERSTGSYVLFRAQNKRDMANDLVVRANLDATLRLLDPDDLAKSPLLTLGLLPHKPKDQPIFLGPNQPSYRLLAAWVTSLKGDTAPAPVGAAAVPKVDGSVAASGFASDRVPEDPTVVGRKPATSAPSARPDFYNSLPESVPKPAGQILPDSAAGLPSLPPKGTRFPSPTLQGRVDSAPVQVGGKAYRGDGTPVRTPASPGAAKPAAESEATIEVGGMKIPVDRRASGKGDPAESKDKKKPAKERKLDTEALQRLMENRNRGS